MRLRATWAGFALGGAALMAAACGGPSPTAIPSTPGPAIAELLTLPSPVPSPTIVIPTVRATCTDGARFLEDLTIPDRTHVGPGATLDKRWSVQNSGTCDWGPDYRLVHQGGSGIEGPSEIALYPARSGAQAIWQVSLRAPEQPGEYQSRWQARAPDGTLFGDEVFIVIVVDRPAGTLTPAPSRAP
jgi:Ig-like domain from next to BRCA1 gene